MCGETRVRVGFGPLPLFLHIYSHQGTVQTLGFVQIKSSPQLQLRVLRLCSTTRQRRHRTPPSLINLSSYIHNIHIAISVSCLFSIWSQEIDPRGQVDRAPAWSITPQKLVQRLLRRDVSHVRSRIVKVDSHRNDSHHLIETPGHLRLYQVVSDFPVARCDFIVFPSLDRVYSSYLQSTKNQGQFIISKPI